MKKFSTILLFAGLYFSPKVQGQTTSYNDVASIFYKHCTVCHHDGGGAPFSLMDFNGASAWATAIGNAVQGKNGILMPPWHADTSYITSGHKGARFLQENVLTAVEKNAIIQWVTNGAPQGDTALVPHAPAYGSMEYQLNGVADLTLKIPTFHSNSTPSNSNPYDCFSVATNLKQDRWLRAFEILPGEFVNGSAGNIVHHVVMSVDTNGYVASDVDTSGNCGQQPGQIGIGGWSAGAPPTVFPNDPTFKTGIRIPKGSNFIFQIHYAPGSGGKLDTTKIRLFFYAVGDTAGMRPMHSETMLQNWGGIPGFNFGPAPIPKNAVTLITAISTTSALPAHPAQPTTAMSLFSANPHSHNVCTKMKLYASSGTDTIPVIRISDWNYNWQGNYYYPHLLKIPVGYTLKTEHTYDNTVNNPHLPGAPVDVSFGQSTANEMLFDSFLWVDYRAGDDTIDVKSLLANEPLLQVGIKDIVAPSIQTFIYPNPASDIVNIYVSKKSVYAGRIYNIAGQTILNTDIFNDKVTVDVKNIPPGLYVIEIVDTKTKDRITKKIIISN